MRTQQHLLIGRASRLLSCTLVAALLGSGCSIRKFAANKLGDALASGGTSFSSEEDPGLVASAAPFSLKLMESLLAENPRHSGLLFASASGFTQYAYAFVQQEADEMDSVDVSAALEMRRRARRLYLRARDYALRGLEVAHPDFVRRLRADPAVAVQELNRKDVPFAYWAAASWGAATSVLKDDPKLLADLPSIEALIDRALVLDESFGDGAIHSFLISYEMSRSGGTGDSVARSRQHFDRAMLLSHQQQAAPLVAFAEAVSIPTENRTEFVSLLTRALAIDPAARPEWRLANLIMQRRARWLLTRIDALIAPTESTDRPNLP